MKQSGTEVIVRIAGGGDSHVSKQERISKSLVVLPTFAVEAVKGLLE